jgi:ATP-dependent Lhr-like helicase
MPSAFEQLHPGVQRQLYNMRWPELRALQVKAITAVNAGDGHFILSAATAAGKTEAAFLPVLSKIAGEPAGSIRAMYVGPLKALINDQFGRIEELCRYLDVPVHRWHGDVGASQKSKLLKQPAGVLLITPESIESMFVNRPTQLSHLLGGLRFIVIDELHSFLASERGTHLRSLLFRLARLTQDAHRLIGLSATIGEPAVAVEYLSIGARPVQLIADATAGESKLLQKIHVYLDRTPRDVDPEEEPAHEAEMANDIVKHCKGKTNLVFANSRSDVELFGEKARAIAAQDALPDEFLVHHGSLSADVRHDAEETMKSTSRTTRPATTFCTSTLEMGIDIGSVQQVGQIGAPSSVAGLTQRVGRSGRKQGTDRICRMYIRCRQPDEQGDFFDRLQPELLQTIAVSQLMIEKRLEPPVRPRMDLSTLSQQIISLIAETGGLPAALLYERLCTRGTFDEITRDVFARLLRQLGAEDIVEQAPDGTIILGLVGESLRKDKSFYAVFMSADEFTVLHDASKIGSVPEPANVGEHFVLAGRRWKVIALDEAHRQIHVVPSHGKRITRFSGGAGELHPLVVEQMRVTLQGLQTFPQLDRTGADLLLAAREFDRHTGVSLRSAVQLAENRTALMTWHGTRVHEVIVAMLASQGLAASDERVGLDVAAPIEAVRQVVASLATNPPIVDDLIDHTLIFRRRKYDGFLNDSLRSQEHGPSESEHADAIALLSVVSSDGPSPQA